MEDEDFAQRMIAFYGIENLPNPEQYPLRFEFLVKSFMHYEKMKVKNGTKKNS